MEPPGWSKQKSGFDCAFMIFSIENPKMALSKFFFHFLDKIQGQAAKSSPPCKISGNWPIRKASAS